MIFNKTTVALLCAATLGATAHAAPMTVAEQKASAHDQNAKPTGFAQWRAEQKRQKYADTTDQIVVKLRSSNDVTALKMAGETSNTMSKETNRTGETSLADRGQKIMMDFAFRAGTPLSFVKSHGQDSVVLKLPAELHVNDVDFITSKLASSAYASRAEKNPKRWPMAENSPWGIANVQADQVSDASASNTTVCIIDSGYDITNPDLAANNASGTNDSGTGQWSTPGGSHGTHVAGTIAAVNNNEGVVGVLPNTNVNLHIIKVFTASGWAYSSDLVDAIDDCQTAGAQVVNMSLGGPSSTTSESNAMQAFENDGMLLIAAAGNDGDSTHSYPASYDAVVSVAAVDESGLHAEFSQYTSQVELSGPGEAILSTVGVGDGRQGFITYNGSTTGDDRVLPQSRYVQQGGNYVITNVNGTVSGELASCSMSAGNYSCGNMSGKICIAERYENQSGSNYPEIDPAEACANAGAEGVIVYSNSARPGLQNPFLVDGNSAVDMPTVSVNRALGQSLLANVGSNATLEVRGNTDYAYYNGTSMATPHVAGVAALAWSNNPTCSATEVRNALKQTALDLDSSGRDNRTGWGLVQTKAASDYMAANCTGSGGGSGGGSGETELTNGVAVTGLSGSTNDEQVFTLDVPAGATDLEFTMSGGSGDADLYVSFGSEPGTSSYDCRSWNSGNSESCTISNVQTGTYYVKVHAYSTYSGASLTGSFTDNSGGGSGGQGSSGELTDLSASRNNWLHYTFDMPAGMSTADFSISGGTGDADLYIRKGAQPTTSNYDCRPYESGNNETCTFTNPGQDTWHISIRAYRTFSGVTLSWDVQ
ncbi:S8 family serine peptidase [Planctobacterium marinum]|uniref:S8 family serine peptidase n=1 Tax=Planctobacterium marinum TaxID=1631968 RepID=UPI002B4C103C|nr:S8 family serine peptidase [Planctobacterium marinum]